MGQGDGNEMALAGCLLQAESPLCGRCSPPGGRREGQDETLPFPGTPPGGVQTGSDGQSLMGPHLGEKASLQPETKDWGQDHFPAGSRKRSPVLGDRQHTPRPAPGGRHSLYGCSLGLGLGLRRLHPSQRGVSARSSPRNSFRFGSTANSAPGQAIGCPVSGRDQGASCALIGRRLLARWRAALFSAGAVRAVVAGAQEFCACALACGRCWSLEAVL